LKRVLLIATGWLCIVLGIAGLFLPVLQGILFLAVGLLILSREYAWARRLVARLEARFPQVSRKARRTVRRIRARIRLAWRRISSQ
jgi:uncharacterized membrane protein YbaN (DUF454 family)